MYLDDVNPHGGYLPRLYPAYGRVVKRPDMVKCSTIICMNCWVSQICTYRIIPHGEVRHNDSIMYGDKLIRKELTHR